MFKEDDITVNGIVVESLSIVIFRCKLDNGRELLCHI